MAEKVSNWGNICWKDRSGFGGEGVTEKNRQGNLWRAGATGEN